MNITKQNIINTYGISKPSGIAQINSIHTPLLYTTTLHCNGDAHIYGCVKTPLKAAAGLGVIPGNVNHPGIVFWNDQNTTPSSCSTTAQNATGLYQLSDGGLGIAANGNMIAAFNVDGTAQSNNIVTNNISSTSGSVLSLKSNGTIDCNWNTLVNVGGIVPSVGGTSSSTGSSTISNPNRYEIASQTVSTTDNTSTVLCNISTTSNAAYTVRTDVVLCSSNGDSGSVVVGVRVKNTNGVAILGGMIEKLISLDPALKGCSVLYSVNGANLQINIVGNNNAIKWYSVSTVTRQLY